MRAFAIDIDGNEVTTNFFNSGELILEESSFFLRIPTRENIQANENCVLWRKDFNTFQEDFNSIEKYREWGRGHLVKNFLALKQRNLAQITETAKERYEDLVNNSPIIIQKASMKDIASYLGITDTSLSRIRKELVNK